MAFTDIVRNLSCTSNKSFLFLLLDSLISVSNNSVSVETCLCKVFDNVAHVLVNEEQ